MNARSRKRIFFLMNILLIYNARKWKLFDEFEFGETLMKVNNYADIFVEAAFREIECRLAQMNVFSHYCLTFSANDCVFSLNKQQRVFQPAPPGWNFNSGWNRPFSFVHASMNMPACTLFNKQKKGPNLLIISTWSVLGKQNVQAKKRSIVM